MTSSVVTHSQPMRIEGKICDKSSGKGLDEATIRMLECPQAACTNIEGKYIINLPVEKVTLIVSCMGYISDTISVNNRKGPINIYLSIAPKSITLESLSAHDTVINLITRAIRRNENMKAQLLNYVNEISSRCIIKSNNDLGLATGSFQLGINNVKASTDFISRLGDSIPLKIKNIYESRETGYFKNPDYYKEVIIARNTNSGLPPSISVLMGGRLWQNFFDSTLSYFDQPLPGPLSEMALNYYHFDLKDTLMMDNEPVYKIFFEPVNMTDPGFKGYLYISAKSFSLFKVDVELNRAANIGGAFEKVKIYEQFLPVCPGIYMPVDYKIYATVNYLLFASSSYELRSVINNYKFNDSRNDSLNNNAYLTIIPGSYKKELTFWQNIQTLPYTSEESEAACRLDSMKTAPRGFWEKTYSTIMAMQYELNNNYSVSGPSSIYQFNHVEGHIISLNATSRHFIDENLDAKITVSNGFSDKRVKEKLSMIYYLGDLSTDRLSFNAYNKLATLFSNSDSYSSLTSTILALFSNHDFRSYYYTKGFDSKLQGEVLPFLSLNGGYSSHSDYTAVYHSNFSLFGGGRRNNANSNNTNSLTSSFTSNGTNPPIYENYISSLDFGFNFDFRNFVEENRLHKRESLGKSFITFGGGVLISDTKLLKSAVGFTTYDLNVQGALNTFRSASLGFRINGFYSKGPVPFQMQYALPGNITGAGKSFSFRTVGISNLFGDQVLTLNLEHNFREELLRLLPGTIFQNMNLQLTTFFNAAWKNMSQKSAAIMPIPYTILNKPLLEAGFNIGHSIIPVGLEFAWRLTYVDRSSFRIGINTTIL